jgi:hypothetical protein
MNDRSTIGWLAVLLSGAACPAAAPAAAAAAGDESAPALKAEIRAEGDLKLDWPFKPYLAGGMFFLSVHRSGTVNSFVLDGQTGAVRFLHAVDLASDLGSPSRHLDIHMYLSPAGIMYMSGMWTHAHGDGDSIGLSWHRVDAKSGAFTKLGSMKAPAGILYPSVDASLLYLAGPFAKGVFPVRLAADGTPTVGEKITGKGVGCPVGWTQDRRHGYSAGGPAVAHLVAGADGKISSADSVEIPGLPDKSESPCVFLPPGGEHVYVVWRCNYGKRGVPQGFGAIFVRDLQTGALSLKEKIELDDVGGITDVAFTGDGKGGYYCGEPESPAAGLSWFRRDPQTGRLTLGKKVPGANPASYLAYAPQTGTIYLGGTASTKGAIKIFSVPKEPAPVARSR